jgi:putative ABC transport system permease protein
MIFLQQTLEKVATIPGVQSVALISHAPLMGGPTTRFSREGSAVAPLGEEPQAYLRIADAAYLQVMRIPLLSGRWFTTRDSAGAPQVVVVSQSLAHRLGADLNLIGQRLRLAGSDSPAEIVGVVADVEPDDLRRPSSELENRAMIYRPYLQFPPMRSVLMIRTTIDPITIASEVKREVWSVDKTVPAVVSGTMEQVLRQSSSESRFNTLLLGIFAAFALLLTVLGLYGVIAYNLSQRTREIGVRIALGAQRRDVLKLVIGQGMKVVLAGMLVGMAGALALTRLMRSLLFSVTPADKGTFIGASAVLLVIAFLACYVPARRATKVDPLVALRYD